MSDVVVEFSCPGGSHAWGKVQRAELVEVSEWVERATCSRCGAMLEVYFDNGEEIARFIHPGLGVAAQDQQRGYSNA